MTAIMMWVGCALTALLVWGSFVTSGKKHGTVGFNTYDALGLIFLVAALLFARYA